jgi:hypothetical protein
LQQRAYLVEREAEFAGAANEGQALDMARA